MNSGLGGSLGSLGRGRPSSDQLLSLGSVVSNILLGEFGGLGRVLAGDLSKLLALRVDNVAGLLEVVVDELLVSRVDKGRKENDRSGNQGKAPVRNDLDKVVRDKGTNGSLMNACQRKLSEAGKAGKVYIQQQK